jgi:hypothetical protein
MIRKIAMILCFMLSIACFAVALFAALATVASIVKLIMAGQSGRVISAVLIVSISAVIVTIFLVSGTWAWAGVQALRAEHAQSRGFEVLPPR